jgi:type I restriction enzyme S subunit
MKLETFFEKFDLFAAAPHAVEKLRALVLDLAVTGRLVPSTRKWETRPLKYLATKIGSGATPTGGRASYFTEGVPLIRSMNVHFRGFIRDGLAFLSDKQAKELSNVTVEASDVLLNITGASIGRVTTAPPEMAGARVNQHVAIIRPTSDLAPSFLAVFLASPLVQRMIDDVQVGATRQALTKAMIEAFEIPLPTLGEQKRIVAKVDELMGLCDRLEAQQQERETRRATLAQAALARFAGAPTAANLNFLFHDSYTIDPADLRNSILTLAVQGQLVEHRSVDGDARSIFRGSAAPDAASARGDARHSVPPSWCWIRFAAVGEQRLGKMLDQKGNRGQLKPYLRNTNVQWMRFALDDIKQLRLEVDELEEYRLRPGDLLICEGGEPGRCAIWRDRDCEMYFQKALHRVRPREGILAEYLAICLQVDAQNGVLERAFTGATIKHLTGRSLSEYSIPIPPLAEQKRIVARVTQLLSVVDRLEAQLSSSHTAAEKVTEAMVAELTTWS